MRQTNPVEIYKRLPRTNCGACRQKSCMPFSFALLKGEADLSECPGLAEEDKDEIAAHIGTTDWREELIISLRSEVNGPMLKAAAQGLGARFEEGRLRFDCFGGDVEIDSSGEIRSNRNLTPWMRMLVLFYIKNGGRGELSRKWVLHSELRGGLMKYKAFRRECEEPLRELFDTHLKEVGDILLHYGAESEDGFAAPYSWLVKVFPRLPVLFLYWPEDEEFESKVTIRFDSTADNYFDVEQIIFMVEELIKDIEALLGIV